MNVRVRANRVLVCMGILLPTLTWGITQTRMKLGTFVTIEAYPESSSVVKGIESAFDEIDRLDRIFSTYQTKSELSQLNNSGELNHASLELVTVLTASIDVWKQSGGAFDPTVKPLLDMYRDSFTSEGLPPSVEEVERTRNRLVGFGKVSLSGSHVRFAVSGMMITLDGIAKGYIIDAALSEVLEAGATRAMVNIGGDLDLPPSMCPHPELGYGCGERFGDRFRCRWAIAQ